MPSSDRGALRVTALAISAELGGTERVLLDFAARAFEFDIALCVLTPRAGPLIGILNELGVPAHVVEASRATLRGSQRAGALATLPLALAGLKRWARRIAQHPVVRDADVLYSVSFKTHLATLFRPTQPVEGGRRRSRSVVWHPTQAVEGGRRRSKAVVWHLHEFPPAGTGIAWKALARRVPDAVIANSRAVADAWSGSPANRQPLTANRQPIVVPNGVDLDRFRPRERSYWLHDQLAIPRDDRLIGMPAVLARWKGQLEVIDAFARLSEQFPEVHLVLVGGNIYHTAAEERYDRELRRTLERQRAAGLTRVHLVPFQPRIELVYPEFDVTVHYSTRPEAFGRVVVEAMACGVPVVAAAEGGPREIVTEGGWLVPPRKPEALASALVAALRLPAEQLSAVGRQGRVRAEDHYSARRFAREVALVLHEVGKRENGVPAPPQSV